MIYCRIVVTIILSISLNFLVSASKDGLGVKKSRSIAYKNRPGSLAEQYMTMKRMHELAKQNGRELTVVYGADTKHGVSGFNLCDIFDLPNDINCEKNMKMKCSSKNSTSEEASQMRKKKIWYHCDESHMDIANFSPNLLEDSFSARLTGKRIEEVQYVQAMMGVVKKQAKKVEDYTVMFWADSYLHLGHSLGKCSAGEASQQESAPCRDFKATVAQLIDIIKPYCNHFSLTNLRAAVPAVVVNTISSSSGGGASQQGLHTQGAGLCYLAGATQATAQEASILLDMGLQSFRGVWLQHQNKPATSGKKSGGMLSAKSARELENMLVHINPVSAEVMEYGIMLDAGRLLSLLEGAVSVALQSKSDTSSGTASAKGAILLSNLVEFERANAGKSFCTAHRDGIVSSPASEGVGSVSSELTWCGRLKAMNYAFTPHRASEGEDDGPFENPTLNKFVVNLALYLLYFFSSRMLQLGLGFASVVIILALFRLCYVRWRRTSTKTF